MTAYTDMMNIRDRLKQLRRERAMTQEDLVAISGVSLATIQRAERGQRVAAETIASLAAAFDIQAADLTTSQYDSDFEPYVPLKSISSGRQLLALIAASSRLDFNFVELHDLGQAELVERLQAWCRPLGPERIPDGAVAQVQTELQASQLLKEMAEADLTVMGATFEITAYEVDDDGGMGTPILFGQWEETCAVIRVGTSAELVDRAHVLDGLGKWETPKRGVVFPPPQPISSDDLLAAFGVPPLEVDD